MVQSRKILGQRQANGNIDCQQLMSPFDFLPTGRWERSEMTLKNPVSRAEVRQSVHGKAAKSKQRDGLRTGDIG